MKLLQGFILAAVVLDATLVLVSTAGPATSGSEVVTNESILALNTPWMAQR